MRDPRPLVIVAEKVEGTALQMLVHNHVNGHIKATAIQAPGFGEKRIHLLEDMAALCGGKVLSKASSFTLEQVGRRAPRPGRPGAGDQREHRDHRRARAAGGRSSGGWRSCAPRWPGPASAPTRTGSTTGSPGCPARPRSSSVGAPTNAELKEVRHRVDDSLQATRAAMAEGIVAGGGAALLHAEPALDALEVSGDYRIGVEIVRGVADRAAVPDRRQRRLPGPRRGQAGHRPGRRRGLRRAGGPLREHGRDGHHRPAAGGALRAAERRIGGRADPHHELAGGRGADAVEQGADDRVRPAGRGHPAAVAGLAAPRSRSASARRSAERMLHRRG